MIESILGSKWSIGNVFWGKISWSTFHVLKKGKDKHWKIGHRYLSVEISWPVGPRNFPGSSWTRIRCRVCTTGIMLLLFYMWILMWYDCCDMCKLIIWIILLRIEPLIIMTKKISETAILVSELFYRISVSNIIKTRKIN